MDVLLTAFDNFSVGFAQIAHWSTVWAMFLGMAVGFVVGAAPGLSPAVGCAMMLPLTFSMEPSDGLLLLIAVYLGAEYGGSISAILINTPGTAGAIVTTIDGYEMTKQGRPGHALGISLWASTIGGVIGSLVLIFLAVPLAKFAMGFESYEYFSLAVLGLTVVSSLAGESYIKGFAAALLGLLLTTVGFDHQLSFTRFTFGLDGLQDGITFIPAIIGLFALSEVFNSIEKIRSKAPEQKALSSQFPRFRDILPLRWAIGKASIIGALLGAVPGHGAAISAVISYNAAKQSSKNPELFGKGSPEGIAAPQASNHSCVPTAMIPLLSLGIPGCPTTAIMLGALMIHRITPGPDLFRPAPHGHPEIVYGLFISVLLANFAMLLMGLVGNKLWIKVISFPNAIIYPIVISLALVGSYFVSNSMFDVGICFVFGLLGWVLKRNGYPTAPIFLGLILGSMVEENLRLSLIRGSALLFFTRPVSAIMLAIALITFVWPFLGHIKKAFRLAPQTDME